MSRGERKAMIRRDHPGLKLEPSMRSAFDQPVVLLLRDQGGESGEPGVDAADRRAVSQISVLRLPPDGAAIAARRRNRWPSPGSPSEALDGLGGDLSGAADQRSASGTQDLSVSSQGAGNQPTQSGLVRRYHLHPGSAWLSVSGCDHGLGNPPCSGMAAVEHHGMPGSASKP